MTESNKGLPDYKSLEERMQEQNDEYMKYLQKKKEQNNK